MTEFSLVTVIMWKSGYDVFRSLSLAPSFRVTLDRHTARRR